MNQTKAIEKIQAARALYDKNNAQAKKDRERLIEAARAACDAGASLTDVAKAAGVSRRSLYLWLGGPKKRQDQSAAGNDIDSLI